MSNVDIIYLNSMQVKACMAELKAAIATFKESPDLWLEIAEERLKELEEALNG